MAIALHQQARGESGDGNRLTVNQSFATADQTKTDRLEQVFSECLALGGKRQGFAIQQIPAGQNAPVDLEHARAALLLQLRKLRQLQVEQVFAITVMQGQRGRWGHWVAPGVVSAVQVSVPSPAIVISRPLSPDR